MGGGGQRELSGGENVGGAKVPLVREVFSSLLLSVLLVYPAFSFLRGKLLQRAAEF